MEPVPYGKKIINRIVIISTYILIRKYFTIMPIASKIKANKGGSMKGKTPTESMVEMTELVFKCKYPWQFTAGV